MHHLVELNSDSQRLNIAISSVSLNFNEGGGEVLMGPGWEFQGLQRLLNIYRYADR
jgi:hypothetical protein